MPQYNLIEYSSNYSETTGSLWFYSKDEGTNFIFANNNFKYFKYKTRLLENTEADGANGSPKYATTAGPLKYLSNFQRLLAMSLINCKV